MRICLINEAWPPLVNGVVTTWTRVYRCLTAWGHDVHVLHPAMFRTVPCPGYPEIRLSVRPRAAVSACLEAIDPEAVHIATEGPLGAAARRWCLDNGMPFTTSYHSQFPEYLKQYIRLPVSLSYPYMRRFHAPARRTLVPTPSMKARLEHWGFEHVKVWSRGVDGWLFQPRGERRDAFAGLPRPIFICGGRVAREKNLPAFLGLDLPGTKVVMGAGPVLGRLMRKFPDAVFTGYQSNEIFSWMMACADVKVFPSLTDTFGLVMLEAMAAGVPVAAHPVTGPVDVIRSGEGGVLDENLRHAAMDALDLSRDSCRAQALSYTWDDCARDLLAHLEPRASACRSENPIPARPAAMATSTAG